MLFTTYNYIIFFFLFFFRSSCNQPSKPHIAIVEIITAKMISFVLLSCVLNQNAKSVQIILYAHLIPLALCCPISILPSF